MYNTPNTFGIYVAGLVAEWVAAEGGLVAMAEQAAARPRRSTISSMSIRSTAATPSRGAGR
jgi:phosphoserine aminotransferase